MCLSEQSGQIPADEHLVAIPSLHTHVERVLLAWFHKPCGCVFVYTFCHWEARWIRGHVILGVCLLLQEPALGSAGFNQHHHLPLLRVICAQWGPLSNAPLHLCSPQHPSTQHGAICMYIVSLAHTAVIHSHQLIYSFSHTYSRHTYTHPTHSRLRFQLIFSLKDNNVVDNLA